MPVGAIASEGSSGESISHYAAIRLRAYGNGYLFMKVYSLDDIKYKILVPFQLTPKNRIIPTRIVNFTEQRVSFEFKTISVNVRFRIHRIIVFTKEVATSYPGS